MRPQGGPELLLDIIQPGKAAAVYGPLPGGNLLHGFAGFYEGQLEESRIIGGMAAAFQPEFIIGNTQLAVPADMVIGIKSVVRHGAQLLYAQFLGQNAQQIQNQIFGPAAKEGFRQSLIDPQTIL